MNNKQDKSGPEQQAVDLDLQNANKQTQGSNLNKNKDGKKEGKKPKTTDTKDQGKFVELPGAEIGKVVVRFPPEASGYLHIGHAKAALLNQHYQLAFNGRLVMRFDDTNPAKEKEDFEKVILEDLDMLKIKPDTFTYTSDYFDTMLVMCESLLKTGHAFVDNTDGDKMRLEREQRIESVNRNNSIEKNLELWNQMKLGSAIGQTCCVRAKIDMGSVNGCMRDPTIYRCKPELHPRTADKYKVYPTYDFACPIVDSIEGITHCLRTTEYTDRDQQFYWFCDALKLGQKNNETRPFVWSYSRLNMTNTVLSKRKLTWFVEEGLVDGWEDPRMPTVRGVFRRGMQLEALKQFIISQGSSRTVTAMQWDKIWSINRSIIDPIAPRHTALLRANSTNESVIFSHDPVEVLVENVEKPYKLNNVPKHPKNSQLGFKECMWGAPKILIDYSDAELLKVGQRATFINWGNLLIKQIERNPDNKKIEKVYAITDLENTDFKSTVKITWLPNIKSLDSNEILPSLIPVVCVYFEHLVSKPVLSKDDDFKQFITKNSRWELKMWGDFELQDLKKSEVIQLQRRGFFICDSPYQPYSIHTGKETPLVLFHIPDGHSKSGMPITSVDTSTANTIKEINLLDKIQSVNKIIPKINEQKYIIQTMNAAIDEAVKTLLALKGEYKSITGEEFPSGDIPTPKSNSKPSSQSVDGIITKINEQGDIVRTMKSKGASMADIGEAIKTLLALKREYKSITGEDFPSGGIPIPKSTEKSNSKPSSQSVDGIITKINEQGDIVRTMKSKGASKADIGEAVKTLLALKGEYKSITGEDFPSGGIPTPKSTEKSNSKPSSQSVDGIITKINEQGDIVRTMKSKGASKADIGEAVKTLLALKGEYKSITGEDFPSGGIPTPKSTEKSNSKPSSQSVDGIITKINEQGDIVRTMKSKGASKADIGEAVKTLLALKGEYKSITGEDFPSGGIPTPKSTEKSNSKPCSQSVDGIITKINEQGDIVRTMKSKGASKADIGEAVKTLLALKGEYKSITGEDFPSGGIPTPKSTEKSNSKPSSQSVDGIITKINEQGDIVRTMKSKGASKADIGEAVKILLALKGEYKSITGEDFPSGGIPTPKSTEKSNSKPSSQSVDELITKINEQGNNVRAMKSMNASKSDIEEQVNILLKLKAEYKSNTGQDYQPSVTNKSSNAPVKKPNKKENITVNTPKTTGGTQTKKVTKLGLEVPKNAENLGDWYSQVLVKSEMIEYYDVSGCYILRPWAYKIWSILQEWFDARIKSDPLNVENCYFPIFVSKGALEKEKEHIADFAPEVAWVTKSGETDLAEPIAIRPTSETVMYPAFAKWIQSYRDFPLKLNQWNNVVRWEFKHPQPFLRTREFLWQEGHHAYATQEEAERDVLIVLDYYEHVYKNMLAVPVIKGRKTEKEKFAGGVFTATCEAYIPASGRAIQGATSHYLGTNFARMFDVEYKHPITQEQLYAHQISYGMTTRTIGVMVMVHGDDHGLVLPPNVATIQVIIVICGVSTSDYVKQNLMRTCLEVCNRLKGDSISKEDEGKSSHRLNKPSTFIRAHVDLRDNYSPGWKFNHWELKGVPLRLEIGPKDLDRGQITAVRRDTGEKLTIPLDVHDKDKQDIDPLVNRIDKLLNQIQQDMLAKAEQEMKNNVIICRTWSDCAIHLAKKRLLLVPFCGQPACEDNIKRDTARDDGTAEIGASTMGAKSLCVPFEQPDGNEKLKPEDKCIHPECSQSAGFFTLFGRSY